MHKNCGNPARVLTLLMGQNDLILPSCSLPVTITAKVILILQASLCLLKKAYETIAYIWINISFKILAEQNICRVLRVSNGHICYCLIQEIILLLFCLQQWNCIFTSANLISEIDPSNFRISVNEQLLPPPALRCQRWLLASVFKSHHSEIIDPFPALALWAQSHRALCSNQGVRPKHCLRIHRIWVRSCDTCPEDKWRKWCFCSLYI